MTRRTRRMVLIVVLQALAGCSRGSAGNDDVVKAQAYAADSGAPPLAPHRSGRERADSSRWEVTARVGELTIERRYGPAADPIGITWVKLKGKTVFVDSLNYGIGVEALWPIGGGHVIALLEVGLGGTGCPVKYRILEFQYDSAVAVTEEFGTCVEEPDTIWFDRAGALRMRFSDFAPFRVEIEPGYRPGPPTTWIYRRGGRLEYTDDD